MNYCNISNIVTFDAEKFEWIDKISKISPDFLQYFLIDILTGRKCQSCEKFSQTEQLWTAVTFQIWFILKQ